MTNLDSLIETAREADVVSIMDRMGLKPSKGNSTKRYYISPFRSEGDPSFVVYARSNSWYDWGSGESGDGIDLVSRYMNINFKEAIEFITGGKATGNIKKFEPKYIKEEPAILIKHRGGIENHYLIKYGESRGISRKTLSMFCEEVHISFSSSKHVTHHTIGFMNNKLGYEFRNHKIKVSNSPKSWRFVSNNINNDKLDVFEGFFDFLSHVEYNGGKYNDSLILNSLVFLPMVIDTIKGYGDIRFYFDNDVAANKALDEYVKDINYKDMRVLYPSFEDYNDYIKDKLIN